MLYDFHNHIKRLLLESRGSSVWSFFKWLGAAVALVVGHHLFQRLDLVPPNVWIDVGIYAIGFVCFLTGFLRR